jgi:hypothetical protein
VVRDRHERAWSRLGASRQSDRPGSRREG